MGGKISTVAVLPIENLSGAAMPTDAVRQAVAGAIRSAGVRVLDSGTLDTFMVRHRVRYAAGIDSDTARLLKQEADVDGVLVASVELSRASSSPKVALIARLVWTGDTPTVAWADDAGLAANDAPGLFGLGVVNDYRVLLTRATDRLCGSLSTYLRTGDVAAARRAESRFRPKASHRDLTLERGRTYSVAVVPFFNLSERRTAGEILELLFMRHLASLPQFRVVDAGDVRRELLDNRVIMESGLSLSDAEAIAAPIAADFVLTGRVIHYQDYDGPVGTTRVEFSTVLIDKSRRKVVWSSESYNDGTDGEGLFGRGVSRTAHAMATQMVRIAAGMMAGSER